LTDTALSWGTEKRKLKDLKPFEANPRRLTEKQYKDLKESLEKFSLVEIPAINQDNTILAGHMRVKTLEDIHGDDFEIEVRVPSRPLTNKEAQEYLIRSNKNTGEWDWDVLANSFDMGDLNEWGFDESDFPDFDMNIEDPETEGDDDVPESFPSITVKGDLYELGEHRVLCGDSTIITDVEKLMDGKKVEMVFTDPPYGIGISSNPVRQKHDKKDWDNKKIDIKSILDQINPKKSIIWGGNYFGMPSHKGYFVWDKIQPENFTLAMCEMAYTDIDTPAKIFKMRVVGYEKFHPTQKPIELIVWCFKFYNSKTVLDLFLGSGSTLIACEKTKRKCFGMELDEKYCDVIVKRYVDFCKKNDKEYSVFRNGKVCKDFENG